MFSDSLGQSVESQSVESPNTSPILSRKGSQRDNDGTGDDVAKVGMQT